MKHVKTITTRRKVVDHTTCDFCKAVIRTGGYEFEQVELSHDEGTRYPEGGSGTKTTFDCCGDCWSGKVLPALRALGAEPSVEEWDT